MSATFKSNETSATQKFFRKLHLNGKNTTTRAELVQQQQQLKSKANAKDTKTQDRHKKSKKLSTLLSNRRQDQDPPKKKKQCTTEHGITSPPTSPTPNHKQGQPRRASEINGPQSPKQTGSPAVMSDSAQNQILQEQLEKLAAEQEKKPEICLPSPPITPAALMTPESELEPKTAEVPVVRPRRLRPAASFAALRPGNHSPHLTHYISRAQPISYIDACGDYMIVKKACFEEPLKRAHRQRIHKRLSEHDLKHSDHLPEFLDERFFYQLHHDTSSDSSQSEYKAIRRVDSAKSIASAPEHKYENLKNVLEKERAVVRALQKQKEACNRDVAFLSRTNEDLTTANQELKKKLEYEKVMKERFQDDLSSTMDKLSEATEQIRKLESQNKQLKFEKDEKEKEVKELKRHRKPSFDTGRSADRHLSAQLRHSQNQVRILKSTMEQFLRMGVFNDELPSNVASPTTSIESIVFEQKPKRKARTMQAQNKMALKASNEKEFKPKRNTEVQIPEKPNQPEIEVKKVEKPELSNGSIDKAENEKAENKSDSSGQKTKVQEPKKQEEQIEKKNTMSDLDNQLRELVREKEILQGEYSKAPSSGGNALVRRRREELESKLDLIDSQMCRIKLKIRSRQIF